MKFFWILIAVITTLVGQINTYPYFRFSIPNGYRVPHPCRSKFLWKGVGHYRSDGGGPTNAFGQDFYDNGFVWDRTICEMDSDGDGKTNGEELGDPNCIWKPNTEPEYVKGISHPGVCEPIDSFQCRGKSAFLDCARPVFRCAALEEDGVFELEARLPKTPIPKQQTSHTCSLIEFPTDADYHMVAFTPHIDNHNVVHHMVMFGCRDDVKFEPHQLNKPQICNTGGRPGCVDLIAVWTVGVDGHCFHPNTGILVGKTGYKHGIVELHWSNPEGITYYTDSSGFNLHLTKNLREFNAGILMVGEKHFEIPPHEPNHTIHGGCPSRCTEQYMSGPINIFAAANHMHLLGIAAQTTLVTPDNKVTSLSLDKTFKFEISRMPTFDPISMNPGDTINVTCHYGTMSMTRTTYFGQGISHEMCYAFLIYYPREHLLAPSCVSHGVIQRCDTLYEPINGCIFARAMSRSHPVAIARFTQLTSNCDVITCLNTCKDVVKRINQDPCFKGENRQTLKRETHWMYPQQKAFALQFWGLLESCDREIQAENYQSYVTDTIIGEADMEKSSATYLSIIPAAWLSVLFVLIGALT